ncbi:lactonase family protein [Nonomuraea sp. NPDC004354]
MSVVKHLFIGGYGPDIVVAGKDLAVLARAAAHKASFLAFHPAMPVLYAVGEDDRGTVSAYSVAADRPAPLGERSSEGGQPCHVAVHPGGRLLAVANYGDGVVSLHELDENGAFAGEPVVLTHHGSGPVWERQERPHAHQIVFHQDVLHVCDLGTDEIRRYALDGRALEFVKLPAGMGPRHLVFDGDRCHVAGELDAMVRSYDSHWNELAAAPASQAPGTNYPSHIEAADDYVYVANRGPDTIAVLRRTDLAPVTEVSSGGAWPRHFAIDGAAMYVANQTDDAVSVLSLHGGLPRPTGGRIEVVAPACVLPR